jgi:hypothetical protein
MRSCESCGDTGTRRWRVSVDEWDSDECPDCRPLGTCHVTDCYNAAAGGEIGESGDLLLCAEHLRGPCNMADGVCTRFADGANWCAGGCEQAGPTDG